MSNDKDTINRLFKLQAKINMMVVDGSRDAKAVADQLQKILDERQQYLRYLETITLPPAKGGVTLANAKQVFTGWIDDDFKDRSINVPSEDTAETQVDVYQMTRSGSLQTLFGSLGDMSKFCLTQGQIVQFCWSHLDVLQQRGEGVFFLSATKHGLFCVCVTVAYGEFEVHSERICEDPGDDYVWDSNPCHRFVVKQPAE